jgi:hypothetical protein
MYIGRVLLWLLAGALIGFGALVFGVPVLIVGLLLVIVGALLLGNAGLWAALVGFGGLPAGILIWDVTSAPWACSPSGGTTVPNLNYYTCVDTIFGRLTTYHVWAFGFGLIALVGLAWPLLHRAVTRTNRAAA